MEAVSISDLISAGGLALFAVAVYIELRRGFDKVAQKLDRHSEALDRHTVAIVELTRAPFPRRLPTPPPFAE